MGAAPAGWDERLSNLWVCAPPKLSRLHYDASDSLLLQLQGTKRFTLIDPTPLGGLTSTGPTVRMTRDGMIHLFVRGVDKSIWYKSQALVNETLQFGAWKLLGGNTRAFSC